MATPKKDQKLVFKTNYSLMQVKSIAECSKGSILQYFRPSLSYHLLRSLFCLFLSGNFTQLLLYIIKKGNNKSMVVQAPVQAALHLWRLYATKSRFLMSKSILFFPEFSMTCLHLLLLLFFGFFFVVLIWFFRSQSTNFQLFFFYLILYIPVNNLSVMSGGAFLGWTSTKQGLKCLAQGNNAVTPVRLEPVAPRSRVKHSTTETLCSLL